MGLSHKQTVLAIYAMNIVLAGTGVLLTYLTTAQGMFTLVIITTLMLYGAQKVGVIGKTFPKPAQHESVGK